MKVTLVCTQCQSEIGIIDQDFTLQLEKNNTIHVHLSNTKKLKKVPIDKEKETLKGRKKKLKKFYLLCSNNHKVGSEFMDGNCLVDGTDTSVLVDDKLTKTVNWKKTESAKPFLKTIVETVKKEKKEIKKKPTKEIKIETKKETKKETKIETKEKKEIKKEKKPSKKAIKESKIPTNPPFLAYVGNLPLTVTKEDLKIFGDEV
jgi:hypothetical protein